MQRKTVPGEVLAVYKFATFAEDTGDLVHHHDYAVLLDGDEYPRRVHDEYLSVLLEGID
jgi:hypothetical protein